MSHLTPRTPRMRAPHGSETLSLKALTAAVCGVLGMSVAPHATAASTVSPDGRTGTTVTTNNGGSVFTVTTTTTNTSGNTAFNSFANFNVGSGDTVNLDLPKNARNLVNLVWNSQAVVNGTVNSYLYGQNQVGGSVYFADPNGIVVGKGGVLNVGALSLSAPTADFMNSLLDSKGNVDPNASAFTTLLQGQAPLADTPAGTTCLICVNGTINANNAVRIRATSIDVSGTIYVSGNGSDTLGTAVNVEGSSTPTLVADGNTIRLDASDSSDAAVGDANANTSVTVEGTLQTGAGSQPRNSGASASSWGEISLTATSDAASDYADPTKSVALKATGSLLLDQGDFFQNGINATLTDANLAASDKAGQFAYVRAFSTANVSVSGHIAAGGDVVLNSATTASATTDATSEGKDGSIPVMMTGMYGAVFSKAYATIANGASITSGGQLSVQSSTDNTLNVAANTVATNSNNVAATTVAWSQAAVDAEATVDGSVNAASLDIGAHNTNSFTTSASANTSTSGGSVGLAGAVSMQTVKANASLGSTPTTNGNVTIAAESDTTANSTSATTGTDSADESKSTEGDSNADMTDTVGDKTESSSDGKSLGGSLPFKLGSAVAWTDSDNTVTATIGNGVNINTAGDLAVQAIVNDAGIHNAATSETSSEEDSGTESGGSASGSKVNVSAAVTYGNYQHEADAEVGNDDHITAAHIGVGSQVLLPFDWTFGQSGDFSSLTSMGNSLSDFVTGAESIPGLVKTAKAAPEIISDGATSYASASSDGAAVDVGGSVNYFSSSNTDRAWIGDGSTLTSTAAAAATPGSDSWQSSLDWNTAPTDWAHSITVNADTEIATFNLVGDITPWAASTQGSSAAIGGAFNYGGYENSTTAGVGSGVTLASTNDIGVNALGKDTLVVLTPVSGKGGTASLQGTVALTDVDDHTHATLSASDNVTARALDVSAEDPLMVWALSGALAMSNSASIGISIGINSLTTDTLAMVGDNSADEVLAAPDQSTAPTAPTGLSETGGTVKVASLSVLGSSTGEAGSLSVAGSSVSDPSSDSNPGDGSGDKAAESGSGSGLISALKSVQSVADKLREGSEKLSGALDKIDEMTGADTGGSSLLDDASSKLETLSNGDATLQKVIGKVTSLGANSKSTKNAPSTQEKGQFGIGISGAASVNMAQLDTRSTLEGVTLDNTSAPSSVAVQAINSAQLTSVAGGAALTRTKSGSGGGDLAGAVAYSSVADTTAATVTGSSLGNASNVAVQALDGSEQVDIGVGVAVQMGGSGTSATLAGSVSIGTSANQTTASITDSTLDGGSGSGRSLEVTAYDHSSIGIGAGSLALNTGKGNSVNGALGFTYADIGDSTSAEISGHTGSAGAYDINHYDTLTLRALDASLIGAGVATGSISPNGSGLSGAFIWNQIGNSTSASIDGGARIDTSGAVLIQANAVSAGDASVSSLNSLIDAPADASGYDFAGSGLAYTGSAGNSSGTADSKQPGSSSLDAGGWGSSIIAVAGDISVGKNNVGLSFVGSQVSNTHSVSIGDADLNVGGSLGLQAQDNTRILSLAVGGGVSTGQFTGMGSATYNTVSNHDSVLLGSEVAAGDSATLDAGSIDAQSSDGSAIYSLAGNVSVSKGNAALGGAVTYNDIANTISTAAGATQFDAGTGNVSLLASDNASMMTGAVAGGGAKGTALMLSFGWNQTGNTTAATLENGSGVTAGSLDVGAGNASTIESLSGSVGIGGTAGVGLAASVGDIGDSTTATLDNSGLDIGGNATVQATGSGTQYALAVAGSFGGDGAGAGSVSYNTITGSTTASVSQLYGITAGAPDSSAAAQAQSLDVSALNGAQISSLSGGLGFGGDVGIGAAASVSTIGGSTSASLDNSVLNVTQSTQVSVNSTSTINTLSIGGSVGGDVAVSGSNTTNIITNTLSAGMADDGSSDGSSGAAVNNANATTVSATNNATINALAGAVAGAGSAAVGAAVAVNQIGTTTDASFLGGQDGRTYKAAQLVVDAGAGNPNAQAGGSASNINTIAVGAAGGGDVGVAGSVAVNLLSGSTDARIDQGAHVIANDNVGVLASNSQGIDVLAGAAALGGTAGVGVGVVVNDIDGSTSSGIYGSNVTAYGNGNALSVDSGTLGNAGLLNGSVDISGGAVPTFLSNPSAYTAPDLSDTMASIHGVAVNAANQQYIATLGTGASLSGTASVTALAGVNDVGGTTTATIKNASINQADYVGGSGSGHVNADNYTYANTNQQLDVRATSSQFESNLAADLAASGTAAVDGAVATNIFDGTTTASLTGSTTSSQAASLVQAHGNQWSLAGAMGAAASGEVGGAASAAVTVFKSSTDALVDGGTENAGSFSVLAGSATSGSQIGGALGVGIGTAGIAGTALVNVYQSETSATVEDGADVNAGGSADVQATNTNSAQDIAVTGSAGLYAGISGSAVVNVVDDSTHASVDNSALTAASVAVKAADNQSVNAYSGVLGAGLVGVGGGINLSLLQASVGAGLLDSNVTANSGDVDVSAASTRNVTSVAASAGAGAVGVGLSAGVVVAGTGDIDDGGNANGQSNLNASNQVNLTNLSSLSGGSRVDSNVSDYGLDSSQLSSNQVNQINSDSSFDLGAATGSTAATFGASDGVQASVSGGAVNASNGVNIDANVLNSTSNTAGAFAAGLAAAGGSLAVTTLNSDVQSSIGSNTTVKAGNGVSIGASSGDGSNGAAASTNAMAGVGGAVGVSAAVAVSVADNSVTAQDDGTVSSTNSGQGVLSINATDSSSASAGNTNISDLSLGGIVAGTVVVDAQRSSTVNAQIGASTSTSGFNAVNLQASDTGSVSAQGVMGAGGITAAVDGVVATAGDTSQVTAQVGKSANISASSTSVDASASPTTSANAEGITIAGGAGIGANVATANVDNTVQALVGDNAVFGGGNLGVTAQATPTVQATTSGGAGAALLGVNAAVSSAGDTSSVLASVGDDVTLPSGSVMIDASSTTQQTSSAQSITVGGVLAVGAADASATSGVNTTASLGDGNGTAQSTSGNVAIIAGGTDTNDASSKAGSGGLVSGNASHSKTQSVSTTRASVGQNENLSNLDNFSLTATHTANYGGSANSINAAAVGGSGANVDNSATSTVQTEVGSDSAIDALGSLYIAAQSKFGSDGNNGGATGGAGGIVAGEAAGVSTTLTSINSTTIDGGAVLQAGLDPSQSGGNLTLLADTVTNPIDDQSSLSVYGAVPIANAVVNLTGNFDSTLTVGDGSTLGSMGRLDIATYANIQKVGNQASANTGGLATVGTADATNNLTSNQQVDIGNNVNIGSVGEADIVAGKDILNSADTELDPSAVAQAYVRGLIAIPHAGANANTVSNATLTLGSGSTVVGGSDVAIGAMPGTNLIQVDGTGHGYELGFIPATQTSNKQSSSSSADATIDGSVLAGKYNKIAINIDSSGNVTDGGSSAPYQYVSYDADCSTANGAVGGCFNPTTYLNIYRGDAAGTTYSGFDDKNTGALILGGSLAQQGGITYGNDMLVNGGNVYLYGSSIGGNGSVTANGAPSITINNASPDYLILPGMQVGFGSTGSVIVGGGASLSQLGSIAVSQTPSNAQPSITVNSSYPVGEGYTPGIVFLNEVDNLGGSFNVSNASGSLILAPVMVNSQNISVPNGGVSFDHPNQNWFSGSDPTSALAQGNSWLNNFLNNVVSSPDQTAAAIANSVYGGGATSQDQLNSNLVNYNYGWGGVQKTPIVLYGYCAPYINGGADGCGGGTKLLDGKSVPTVSYVALSQSGNFSNGGTNASSAYQSQTLSVTADFININSTINVGTPATWTVQTTSALNTWLSNFNGSLTTAIPFVDANGNALLQVIGANSQLIGASYDPVNKQIVLNNVNASGGGQAYFDGKIVSTGGGNINVNSGFGKVDVVNGTGDALVVNNIYTGSGGLGLVTLVDNLNTYGNGAARTTWYVSQNGGAAQEYTNSNGATSWQNGVPVGNIAAYQPLSGEEYVWSASTDVNREGGSSNWSWGAAGNGTAGQHWSLGAGTFVNQGGSGYQNLHGNDYVATLSGQVTDSTQTDVWYHGCGNSIGSGCHYGTSATGNDPSDKSGNYHSEWDYIYPTAGELTVSVAQRADMPIGIGFATSQTNSVEIDSNANILLNGVISNTNPPSVQGQPDTLLKATNGGSILQNSSNALVWTHDLTMSVTGGGTVGTASNPIQTRIVHDSTPGSDLIATTDGGAININVDSGNSDQAIHLISQGIGANNAPVYGDVNITGTGSLVGIAGQSRDVVGANVSLASSLGGIGSSASPLNVETHTQTLYNGALDNGNLNAQALDDIDMVDYGGDTWVNSIASTVGSVYLSSPNGGIYDARLLAPSTTLSSTQAQAIWTRLGLNNAGSAQNIAASLQNQVNAAYTQYWQLLAVGTVGASGTYTLNANAVPLYWPLAAAANGIDPSSVTDPSRQASYVQAYVQQRYSSDTALFGTYLGSNWQGSSDFASQNKQFNFVISTSSSLYQSLLDTTQWTSDQLTYAINVAALAAPSGAQVGAVTPNISGKDVTLVAGDGGIGRTVAPISINYQDFKDLYTSGYASTDLQKDVVILGMANAPGDIQLLDAHGNVLQSSDPNTAADLATLSIAQTNPLYLTATGAVAGSATGSVYVQANGDLNLDGLTAGTDMRLAATGSINAASGSSKTSPALTTGGNLVLNAGSGHISFGDGSGSKLGDALPVQIGGTLLSASAATDLLLDQLHGNLNLDSVFANGTASLTASNGSILSQLDGLNIAAGDIVLDASGDIGRRVSVGTGVDAPLQVQVGASGSLNADAGGMVNLTSPQAALQVGTITSGGSLVLSAQQAALTAQQLNSTGGSINAAAGTDADIQNAQAQGDVTLTAAGTLTAGTVSSHAGNVALGAATGMTLQSITAQTGSIDAKLIGAGMPILSLGSGGLMQAGQAITVNSSGSLAMGTGSDIVAGGQVALVSSGDMLLGKVQGNAASGTAVSLDAGGRILGNGDALNVQARQGGNVALQAVNDIGSASQPLVVDANTLSGTSTQGNVWLHTLGNVDVTSLTTPRGGLDVLGDGLLGYGALQSSGFIVLAGGSISGGQLTAGTTASLTSAGATTVNNVTTGGDMVLKAGTTLDAIKLNAGTTLTLTAGQSANIGSATANGELQATAQQNLTGGTLQSVAGDVVATATTGDLDITGSLLSGGDATLTAGQDSTLANLMTGGALNWQVGGNAELVQGTVGGTTTIATGGNLALDALQATGDVTTQSGADTTIAQLTVSQGNLDSTAQGNLGVTGKVDVQNGTTTLKSGAAMQLAEVDSQGDLAATAGTTLDATTLAGGANVALTSTGDSTLGQVTSTQATSVQAGGNLAASTLDAGTTLTLTAGQSANIGSATANGELQATTQQNLSAGTLQSVTGDVVATATTGNLDVTGSLQSGGNATLTAGQGSTLANLAAGGALNWQVGGDAELVQGTVGGTTTIATGGNLALDALQATGDVGTQSGADTTIAQLTVSQGNLDSTAQGNLGVTGKVDVQNGSTTLKSGAAMQLAEVDSQGDLAATAGTTLDATTLAGGANVALTSTGDSTLGQVTSAQATSAQAGGNLAATTLDAGTTLTLTAGQSATLGSAVANGELQATAQQNLSGGTLQSVGGDVVITATKGNLDITGSLLSGGDATLTAGQDSTLANLMTGGALNWQVGGNAELVQGTVGGTTAIATGGNLALDALQATGDVTTQSGADTTITQLAVSQGNLDSTAQGNLGVTGKVDVQNGTATLKSGAAMQLAEVDSQGDLSVTAGTTLAATTLAGGANVALTSTSESTLGQVTSAQATTAQAGGNLDVTGSLQSGGNATLTAGQDSTLANLAAGGALNWQVGGDAELVQGTVGGTTTIATGGNLALDALQATGDVGTQSGADTTIAQLVVSQGKLASTAQGNLGVTGKVAVQNGATALKSGAAMQLAEVDSQGDLSATAGTTLAATSLQTGTDGTLTSGQGMSLGQVTTGGDLDTYAGGDFQSGVLNVGGNGHLTAVGSMTLTGATTTGAALDMQAGSHLGFASIQSGGDVFGQSLDSGIDGTSVYSDGSIRFVAPGDIHIGNLHAATDIGLQAGGNVSTQVAQAGHDIDVSAGGDVDMQQTQAGNDVAVDAGGAIAIGTMKTGHGIDLAAQQMTFDDLEAPDSITLLSRAGNVTGASLTTRDAFVAASGDIGLDAAYIGDRINLAATDIAADVTQTSAGQPLYSVLTGYQGGVAKRITVDASASQQWMIDRLSAVQAAFTTTAPRADIASGHIEQTMSLDTADARVRMNQQSALLVPADVQLMQPTYDFTLDQDTNHTFTNAFIVRYGYGFAMQTPNYVSTHTTFDPDYLGESALRNNGRGLQQQDDSGNDAFAPSAIPSWTRLDDDNLVQPPSTGIAVNIQAPE